MNSELIEELSNQLSKDLSGEIRLDSATRKLYSTDASIYQIEPLGVVFPRDEDDLVAIVSLAAKFGVPILPRGSGTSLAGQTVGAALVLDCSRYLNQILDINPEEGHATLQPGVVLDRFNRSAAQYGLKYGPDPASEDRASFGGMLGNNSTGAHSILYGMSSDNVHSMDIVLADGSLATLEAINDAEATRRSENSSLEGSLYRQALAIRHNYADAIKETWPRSWRRASGYSLNYLLPWSPSSPSMWDQHSDIAYPPVSQGQINLAPVFVGSEGTLAVIRSAKIRVVPRPKRTVLAVLNYESVAEACDVTPSLLQLNPSAVELIPQAMIRLARAVPAYAHRFSFVEGDPAAILIVEFSGDSETDLDAKLKALGPKAILARSADQQKEIWDVRKVALGLLMSRAGDSKPLPFIEDVAVPVEQLGDFVRGLERIFAQQGTHGDFYAHASAGCLHVRPLINLKTLAGVRQMRAITAEVVKLANRFGGAMSGEHGDGLARSEWLQATFGSEVMQAFRDLKNAADPQGILNPGKILDAPPMDSNLRYGPGYVNNTWLPVFNFSSQGGLAGAIEMCNGAGICRKDHGVMCPSFQASREEMHSTRGRANLLRGLISGDPAGEANSEEIVFESLDLCLECKGCKSECPSAVDLAKLKYEFLHSYYLTHKRPMRDYIFARLDLLGRIGQPIAPIANWLMGVPIGKSLAQSLFGLSSERPLPRFARKMIHEGEPSTESQYDVLFLNDAFTEFFYPQLKADAFAVLSAAGIRVIELPILGAGRPLLSKGFLSQARGHAEKLIDFIDRLDPEGRLPILGVEPSEIYTLRDEYPDFFPDDEKVGKLAERSYMMEEFLLRPLNNAVAPVETLKKNSKEMGRVLLHGHCYQKAQPPSVDGHPVGQAASAALLSHLGWQVDLIDSGCCGMAGAFGYEAEHYELSMQVGELALLPAVREADPKQVIVAPGVSCRTQITSGTDREAEHPLSLIARELAK
jgi:FAD/FMN-containing dehydrogenase/Fe-S oxidoreductase